MSTTITTCNPYDGKSLNTYSLFTDLQIEKVLENANNTFHLWKKVSITERIQFLEKLAVQVEEKKQELAELITLEMGKPITESIAEIEKCGILIAYYKDNAEQFLSDVSVASDANESFISYEPLGCILAVMPWNYPFWQVFRFAIPTITAGNTAILKHANIVSGCAIAIEDLFKEAGYPEHCFQTVLASHDQVADLIKSPVVRAVSVTGSEKAGKTVASLAAENLKKSVLELGGNNACIIWEDADLDTYMDTIVKARMQNTGQSCIAAKRFIVVEAIYDKFLNLFKDKVKQFNIGNPQDENTTFGVLADKKFAETIKDQVQTSIEKGAVVIIGNEYKEAYCAPTIITEVQPGMPVFDEEVFGPVAAICKVKNREAALQLATTSSFGLGTMLFTQDIEAAKKVISDIPDGSFFINELVKSDPRLPFGGTKNSGFGRELSKEGILEFVNHKTVYINK
ncbi:NAD-dependent succinate-semialdehyde dehydrogenase [Aquimarina sp. ERC-38]|uniref:NAD-dependent succinate-semialdehyde dehydrogenase n=1 Tax=Aquimarina sp. ERC-38 TaxID=2949996 RepID=UPI002246A06E|nr:NAD-dependent succinate-semialdehyde dehydrogenase [Aquimarina sp. ERC-38]UZO81117.1 NAD-dependent succinate-semialdehyde dehydrogenase [Aquimarina sp. ERC-38]